MATRLLQKIADGADYSLLLQRVEKAVIQDVNREKNKAVLQRKDIWEKLPPNQAIKWAGLTQIMGMVDTALEIYELLVKKDPFLVTAWKEYIELLDILGHKKQLVSAVKTAKINLPGDQVDMWIKRTSLQEIPGEIQQIEPAADPFVEMQTRQKLLNNFLSLFAGRKDLFARQWADKKNGKSGYVPVRKPLEISDVEDHLKGLKTYGFYLMDKNASVGCGVIDADLLPEFRQKKKQPKPFRESKKSSLTWLPE